MSATGGPLRALVTGGGGFMGATLVRMLRARGDAVRVLARGDYPAVRALGAETVRGDVVDAAQARAAAKGVDVVFHVAAKAGMWGDAAEYEAVNVTGTQNVIDACRAEGVAALVHTSSPSVTFDGKDTPNADERLPYGARFTFHYPRTKAEAERRVLAANGPTLKTTALRPHLIYGPGDPHLFPRLAARALQGRLRVVGDGKNKLDVTYVDNAAHAHVLAGDALLRGDAKNAGKAYFVTDGEPVVAWEWLNRIFVEAGVPPATKRVPYGVAYATGWALEGVWSALRLKGDPPMTRFVAEGVARTHTYDLTAARRDFGYAPLVDGAAAAARTIPWLREEVAAGRIA